jgi:three-Cys-motif partner protein
MMPVGEWTFRKHKLVTDYVAASYGVRSNQSENTLIDLYCGPGRVYNRDNPTQVGDGGVIAAYKEAARRGKGVYTTVVIGDSDREALDTCEQRLLSLGANVTALYGKSVDTVDEAVRLGRRKGLKLAYLDPFDIETLPFSVIQRLARLSMLDFIIYYAQMDVTRNLDQEYAREHSRFDDFAPGWRQHVDVQGMTQVAGRIAFLQYWLSLLGKLGFKHSREKPLLTSTEKNAPLYRMLLFSRHPLAEDLWNDIAKSPQGKLDFG